MTSAILACTSHELFGIDESLTICGCVDEIQLVQEN